MCSCNRTQVQLPAATKASTREAGADVKESCIFSGAGHMEDRDTCHKAHLHLSVEAEVL